MVCLIIPFKFYFVHKASAPKKFSRKKLRLLFFLTPSKNTNQTNRKHIHTKTNPTKQTTTKPTQQPSSPPPKTNNQSNKQTKNRQPTKKPKQQNPPINLYCTAWKCINT